MMNKLYWANSDVSRYHRHDCDHLRDLETDDMVGGYESVLEFSTDITVDWPGYRYPIVAWWPGKADQYFPDAAAACQYIEKCATEEGCEIITSATDR